MCEADECVTHIILAMASSLASLQLAASSPWASSLQCWSRLRFRRSPPRGVLRYSGSAFCQLGSRDCVQNGHVWSEVWREWPKVRRGRSQRTHIVTRVIAEDAYWITAAQAMSVALVMGGLAAVSGVLINIRVEKDAVKEYYELEEKGILPEDMSVPDEEFDPDDPVYIFNMKEATSSESHRNRPVRDEYAPDSVAGPELEPELKPELILEPELEPTYKE